MKNRVGEVWKSKKGENFTIIEYFGWDNCTIQFEDNTVLYNICYSNIKQKRVKNPNYKSVFGVGYIGQGDYIFDSRSKCAKTWRSMLDRCYSNNHTTYKDCIVSSEWHNYQNFAKWWEENHNPNIMKSWHLDKDIINNTRIYSPETCCFVPIQINNLFKNKGKNIIKNKKLIVNMAKNFKNELNNKIYNKLINI